jgi:hypothetical protein
VEPTKCSACQLDWRFGLFVIAPLSFS